MKNQRLLAVRKGSYILLKIKKKKFRGLFNTNIQRLFKMVSFQRKNWRHLTLQ